jgi:beta-aspartyl-peptidase (threonine type)
MLAGTSLSSHEAVGQEEADAVAPGRWAIALHGGVGGRSREMNPEDRQALEASLQRALGAGRGMLADGRSAVDVVEAVVALLEDDPQFNAGKGAVFTRSGAHELDASIMDGANLRCGAVAAVKTLKNPIKAARLAMDQTPHVLLTGAGADAFAADHGCEQVEQAYFYTDRRFGELQAEMDKLGLAPLTSPAYSMDVEPQPDAPSEEPSTTGTVGCVALDVRGHLAAATSTGGLTAKMPGRLGDSPIIGAGTYANDKSVAVSCTGKGEEFIRHSIAARMGWLVDERGWTVDQAAAHCLTETLKPGDGGLIALDGEGRLSMRSTTGSMPRGAADSTGRFETAIWFDP